MWGYKRQCKIIRPNRRLLYVIICCSSKQIENKEIYASLFTSFMSNIISSEHEIQAFIKFLIQIKSEGRKFKFHFTWSLVV